MKDKLSKIGDKTGKARPEVVGEESDHPTLSLQSEPAITAEGELGGDIEDSPGAGDPGPDDSQPVSQPAVGIGHGQGGSDDKASGGETSQIDLHPHPHVQTESGSSGEREPEVERSQGQELDAT